MLFQRFLEDRVSDALRSRRVVAVTGPRQSGKTTLVRKFTSELRPFYSLDRVSIRNDAVSDPEAFIEKIEYGAIDEAQKAPDLLPTIKVSVDSDTRPGRFLLTGSANILTIPTLHESLAGRMAIKTLLPLAQAEMEGTQPPFLDDLFKEDHEPFRRAVYKMDDLEYRVLKGGYPEMQAETSETNRQDWAIEYVDGILYRDFRDFREMLDVSRIKGLSDLARASAVQSGQLVAHAEVAKRLRIDRKAVQSYMDTLEQMYLIRYLESWDRNELKKMVKAPKLHFLDTGLCAAIRQISLSSIRKNRTIFGPLLESFVFAELLKLAAWSRRRLDFHHYRDLRKTEVDFVISNGDHSIVGIEVKASATARSDDFSGLRSLQQAAGSLFRHGILLYAGEQVVPFGDRLYAAPVSVLWS